MSWTPPHHQLASLRRGEGNPWKYGPWPSSACAAEGMGSQIGAARGSRLLFLSPKAYGLLSAFPVPWTALPSAPGTS